MKTIIISFIFLFLCSCVTPAPVVPKTQQQIEASKEIAKIINAQKYLGYPKPADKRYINKNHTSVFHSVGKVVIGKVIRGEDKYTVEWYYFKKNYQL